MTKNTSICALLWVILIAMICYLASMPTYHERSLASLVENSQDRTELLTQSETAAEEFVRDNPEWYIHDIAAGGRGKSGEILIHLRKKP